MDHFTNRFRPERRPAQPLTPTQADEEFLRALRLATHVQWRFNDGAYETFTGGMKERDELERKGLNPRVQEGRYGKVLSITPEQASQWLENRHSQRGNNR